MTLKRHLLPALFAIFILSPVVFVWADRKVPVDQISNVIINSPLPGDVAILYSEVYRHKSCPVTVEIQIVDGMGFLHPLPDIEHRSPVGYLGPDKFRRRVIVPEVAAPGDAQMRIGLSWRCNFLQTFWPISDLVQPVPFKIARKEN